MTPPLRGPRPLHLDLRALALVAAGGTVGTLLRASLSAVFHTTPTGWPWPTFTVNLTGAFLLGLLLGVLQRHGPDEGASRRARLTLGTGVLGGYTTYSALAVEVTGRLNEGHGALALTYLLATVVLGAAAAAAGEAVSARIHPDAP